MVIRYLYPHLSIADIARKIGKHRSSVMREVVRNLNARDVYLESHAQANMQQRRRDAKEAYRIIDNDLQLQATLEQLFKNSLSPEQIVGYLRRRDGEVCKLCHQTIYDWVHRKWQSRKEWLRFKGKARMPYGSYKDLWQPEKRHISERPAIVEKRLRVGDWEGDLVHGTQDDSRHALLTLVDRATGFGVIWKIRGLRDAAHLRNLMWAQTILALLTGYIRKERVRSSVLLLLWKVAQLLDRLFKQASHR